MTRVELTQQILDAKQKKMLTWADIAKAVGRSEVWTTAALLGQMRRCGTPISLAKRYWESSIGLRNSSSNISPGETGASLVFLVTVKPA